MPAKQILPAKKPSKKQLPSTLGCYEYHEPRKKKTTGKNDRKKEDGQKAAQAHLCYRLLSRDVGTKTTSIPEGLGLDERDGGAEPEADGDAEPLGKADVTAADKDGNGSRSSELPVP